MKKAIVAILAVFLVLGAAALVGCGSTNVSVKTDNGSLDIKTNKGSVELNTKTPTEAQLGIPIYPGAKATANSSASYSQGGQSTSVAQFVTTDSVEKVVAWYKGQLSGKPEYRDMTTAQGGLITFKSGNDIKMVTIGPGVVENKGKTLIVLGTGAGGLQNSMP
ncbi:MAG TPA: hypothetical protein VIK22_08845 [Candidatus Anoxymicrobiaceae bacterium]